MELAERIEHFPEPWKPKAGDTLIGKVIEVDMRDGGFGEYPIVTVQTGEGEYAFHGFHTVAKNEISRQRPRPGDEIAVKYFGRDEAKGYERYRVIVERKDETPGPSDADWNSMEASATEELTSTDAAAWNNYEADADATAG